MIGTILQKEDYFSFSLDDGFVSSNKDKIIDWLDRVASHMQITLDLYKEGLEHGIAKECARMILPMASQTTIYMTGSVRSWIHFLEIRLDGHAQKEAQLIARKIKDLFIINLPLISNARGYLPEN